MFKKALLVALALVCSTVFSPPAQADSSYTVNPCTNLSNVQFVPISVNAAATTQLVGLTAGTRIYVCKIMFIAGGTTSVTLQYGTGVLCAAGTVSFTGPMPLSAQTGWIEQVGYAPNYITPVGQALCIVSTAAVQLSGTLGYIQQ